VAAGGGGDGQAAQLALPVVQHVDQQELLRVHRVVQRQPRKLEVHTHVQRAAGAQPHCAATLGGQAEKGGRRVEKIVGRPEMENQPGPDLPASVASSIRPTD
jgi:hypothetical protein